jgi:hypothetical protein
MTSVANESWADGGIDRTFDDESDEEEDSEDEPNTV